MASGKGGKGPDGAWLLWTRQVWVLAKVRGVASVLGMVTVCMSWLWT